MIITPLGHTEFLLDIENHEGQNVRILVDSWLSGFSIADLMERTVDIELDADQIGTIDAIYISHSHADHLDPYMLTEIYQSASPRLILPCTLGYLVPLLQEYLPYAPIELIFPEKSIDIGGIKITGHMFSQSEITNEDDVMMLSIESTDELLFAEIDTLPEEDDIDVQKALYRILTKKDLKTVCYLASRNELEGQLKILDLESSRQKAFRDEYIHSRKEEMRFSYEKYEYEDFESFPNIFTIPNFVRGFIGQGIAYPRELSGELFSYQIFPLEDIASRESDIASSCGYNFPQKALQAGRQYKVINGNIEIGRKECPLGNLIKKSSDSQGKRIYASGPLFPRESIDYENAKIRILDILNHRFLPYWSASPVASLRSAMIENGGVYRIGLKTLPLGGVGEDTPPNLSYKSRNPEPIIFQYSFTETEFQEVPYIEGMHINESYWLDDILDFLEGRQDLYSNFWHALDPKMIYRLWTCLGANFCNHDLVLKKYRLHFERAKGGDRSIDYFHQIGF